MDHLELQRIVEALLFAADTPLSLMELRELLGENRREDIERAIESIVQAYRQEDRPIQVIEIAGGYQFTSKPPYHQWILELRKKRQEGRLSGPALETLAIIAYKQPVPRSEIERIRGVSADGVLQTLLRYNLVRIAGREKGVGRALLYGTTREFLLHFGLKDLKDLPSLEEIERLFRFPEGEGMILETGRVPEPSGPPDHEEPHQPSEDVGTM